MDIFNRGSIYSNQRDRLLARIEQANKLIDDYEKIVLFSDNPREKYRAQEGINETERLKDKYESQLNALEQSQGQAVKADFAENLHGGLQDKVSNAEEAEIRPANTIEPKVSNSLQELDRKLEELKSDIDDLNRLHGDIYRLLSDTRNQEIQTIITSVIHQGNIQHEEMKQILGVIQEALVTLQNNPGNLSNDIREAVADASSTLDSEVSLQGKLELTLPIIPLLLDYKVELSATDSVDLNKFFESMQNWWKSLIMKASGAKPSLKLEDGEDSLITKLILALESSLTGSSPIFPDQCANLLEQVGALKDTLDERASSLPAVYMSQMPAHYVITQVEGLQGLFKELQKTCPPGSSDIRRQIIQTLQTIKGGIKQQ